MPDIKQRADLRRLPDTALLALLRPLARDSQERAAICEELVDRYAGLVRAWQVRVPRQVQELLLEMRVAAAELTQELGRVPADHEIAARLGVTEDDVGQAREAHLVFTAYSLDAPLPDQDDPAELASTLGEEDHAVEHALDMEAVWGHMDELPEREQRVLLLRFWGNLTQAEIGDRLGISQMHVSRLMTRALKRLRDRLTSEPAESAATIRQRSRRLAS